MTRLSQESAFDTGTDSLTCATLCWLPCTFIFQGNENFRGIYETVWHMISDNEREGIQHYHASSKKLGAKIKADRKQHGLECRQQEHDPLELYGSAAKTKPLFEKLVAELNQQEGVRLKAGKFSIN